MPQPDTYATGTPCWVDLATADVDGGVAFYTAVLGWTDDEVPTDMGPPYHFMRVGGHAVAGLGPQPPEMSQAPALWTTYLAGDADEIAGRVAGAGGEVMGQVMPIMDLGRILLLADPTGAVTGVWEPGTFAGAELVNEPGALTWNELNTPDLDASSRFLEQVFGVTTQALDDAPSPYRTFSAGGDVRGGVQQMGADAERFPPHWMTYFAVDDADATAASCRDHGGHVNVEPFDSPFGRMTVLTDPQGGVFMVVSSP